MNGTVVMKVSETEAQVCPLESDAPVGTRVQLYRHDCRTQYERPGTPGSERRPYICEKQPLAVGTIAQKMGGRCALVIFPQGTQYAEGYTVEPLRRRASDISASR